MFCIIIINVAAAQSACTQQHITPFWSLSCVVHMSFYLIYIYRNNITRIFRHVLSLSRAPKTLHNNNIILTYAMCCWYLLYSRYIIHMYIVTRIQFFRQKKIAKILQKKNHYIQFAKCNTENKLTQKIKTNTLRQIYHS